MLTTTVLATRAPVIIVPAMHTQMYQNPVTQENEARLKVRGFYIIPPAVGRLASGGYGPGRFPDTEVIVGTLKILLGRNGDLAGKRIVVTAGGTQEPIDPVRLISNRSSGKMGFALAEAARDRGAEVILIATPTATLPRPIGVDFILVETANQMKSAVVKALLQSQALIMAAAVADYQVAHVENEKIKKEGGNLTLDLIGTPDILAEVQGDFIKIGFAAESRDLLENARKKVQKKNLDLIVANNITEENSGFGSDTNKVTLLDKAGTPEDLPLMSKSAVAGRILDRLVRIFNDKAKG
jgi:phosphopantothenoylcysteine decarboxylase/phosphopantothenate--cysteine ligase